MNYASRKRAITVLPYVNNEKKMNAPFVYVFGRLEWQFKAMMRFFYSLKINKLRQCDMYTRKSYVHAHVQKN